MIANMAAFVPEFVCTVNYDVIEVLDLLCMKECFKDAAS